ncbi:STAS domain-containing protein, partial [Corallococcus exiguus]|nr:STAS domain-containing protein [Corallococcus exiguus]
LITVAGVVGINLLAGIGLGLGAAILRLLWQLGQVRVEIHAANGVHQVCISGALTFVGVPKLSTALAKVPAGSRVEVDVAVNTLDHSGFEALESWADTYRKTGGTVTMEPLEDVWTRRSARAAPTAGPAAPSHSSPVHHVSTLSPGGVQ